ncbi:hypothetical protein DERF_006517 [Dermatophagoides farinae]|uniref:Uncharacterized protein n=1 Tax=Dermatophagoides farinae TaxID=6954 RepID=A0A922IBS1_DERFA|nr:hypothetical protein DERF_006517 [Dermatophagoides farinae]
MAVRRVPGIVGHRYDSCICHVSIHSVWPILAHLSPQRSTHDNSLGSSHVWLDGSTDTDNRIL